tara:strand:+ start:631 stop:1521 length:891 start_codon:yes stop_codon:yes gene_type:complete
MEFRRSSILRVALPLKSLVSRFFYLSLFIAAFGIMLLGKIDSQRIEKITAELADIFVPLMSVISQPIDSIHSTIQSGRDLISIREQNYMLLQENMRLKQWQQVARKLEVENLALQKLLNIVKEKKGRFISARVVAGTGGPLASSFLLNAGIVDGVHRGDIVLGDAGVVGRISQVAKGSSRVTLLTDFNSRIPVLVEKDRIRAIMVGSNSAKTQLVHFDQSSKFSIGERIVTSGHGGVFPPGLLVGTIDFVDVNKVRVKLSNNLSRLEYVSILSLEEPNFKSLATEQKVLNRLVNNE